VGYSFAGISIQGFMTYLRILLILAVAVCFSQALFAQAVPADADTQKGYLIGPGDVISIKALGEPSFDVEAMTVDEDGMIQIPYSDLPLIAKCKTERGLQAEVVQAWSKYLRKPQINLRVTQRNSRPPVSIYGEVRVPGPVPLTRKAHLLELISFAGGVTEKSGGVIQVFRTRPPMCGDANAATDWKSQSDSVLDVPSRLYSLESLRQGRDESNPEIFAGDIILVQKAAPIYVTGEVMRPGEMSIPEGGLPLTQAVAMASGITREAKTSNVKIYRRKVGSPQPEVIAVNYSQIKKGTQKDVMLEPFDIVEVDKASKKFTDYLLDFVVGVPNRIPIRPF
jgi:polysaccharide biosynthesis/export protein